jgi:hypothetical protein
MHFPIALHMEAYILFISASISPLIILGDFILLVSNPNGGLLYNYRGINLDPLNL